MTREALNLIWLGILALYAGGLLSVVGFAMLKGRPSERYGAVVYLASVLISTLLNSVFLGAQAVVLEMVCDSCAAVGFLALALRYNSLWLGAAMMVKGVQLALHATHLTDGQDLVIAGTNVYALGLTFISFAILGIIFGGTLASVRERRRAPAETRSARGSASGRPAPSALQA